MGGCGLSLLRRSLPRKSQESKRQHRQGQHSLQGAGGDQARLQESQLQGPQPLDDVAVLELGRRVEYNFIKFGDSPTCLPENGLKVANKIATVQGYCVTEKGTKGDPLEANVTVITNQYCKQILRANVMNDEINAKKILRGPSLGLDYGLLCA